MKLSIHKSARADIGALEASDPDAAAYLLVFLEQAQADPKILDKFTTAGSIDLSGQAVGIKWWRTGSLHVDGDLWRARLQIAEATNYRVVYGYHYPTRQLCVLAVVHRGDMDYDNLNDGLVQRIVGDWRSLID